MCRTATVLLPAGRTVLLHALIIGTVAAQTTPQPANEPALEWRRIGNSAMDVALPSLATGSVKRVWYSSDGSTLFAQVRNNQIWETRDFETWKPSANQTAPTKISIAQPGPEPNARIEQASGTRFYALGRHVYRSDDAQTWNNVTGYRDQSILGEGLSDLAVSPGNPDELTVSGQFGIWRSLDGGTTWAGLNEGLPNLPATRLIDLPNGLRAARLLVPLNEGGEIEIEWAPGERGAWRQAAPGSSIANRRRALSQQFGMQVLGIGEMNNWGYASLPDGRIVSTQDRWSSSFSYEGATRAGIVNTFFVSRRDGQVAIAGLSPLENGARVLRTVNGGRTWFDASGNLPATSVNGVDADPGSGAVYLATPRGVYYATTDLANLTSIGNWQRLAAGLPDAPILDVKLDANANQLFVLVDGHGLYAAMAPHRLRELSVVNAADFSNRPAAPGTLLSVLGARLDRVTAAGQNVPVLGATDIETQIQVPFEASGDALSLTLESNRVSRQIGVPLTPSSPAIFLDRDGAPLMLDADSGVALDASNPARSGARIQILATGLGAVNPTWPTGVPAPRDNTPRIVANVRVFLDREPLEVTRATLAPGYIGFYLIEAQLPAIINNGPAELYVDAGGNPSNRVRLYLSR
jgi:uncharacterized protein (TIGR03437 family)